MSKIMYVDISLRGHRTQYLKALVQTREDAIALIPEEVSSINCKQIVMSSGYDKKRTLKTYLRWLKEINQYAIQQRVDLVHILCGDALYRYFGIGLSEIHVPVVVTYHHMLFGKVRSLSIHNIFKKTKMGIVHTEHLKEKLLEIGIKNNTQIEYPVFNGETTLSVEEAKRKIGLPLNVPSIVVLGGTQRYKGVDILLEALKKVSAPFWLHVTGLERAFSREYIEENSKSFSDRVSFQMTRLTDEEYACALAATDILVLPYRYEFDGASGPMIEGVWNRKYIVGAGHGSMGEIIRKHKLGKTFKTEDPDDLADVLNDVLKSNREWNETAEKFRTNLQIDTFVAQNDLVYKDCL